MKKIIGLFFAVLFSAGLYAQEDVIKFLGIPVDGTKQEMIQKLKSKGFTYNQQLDALEGEFNGEQVSIQVQTQNNKVWRIAIVDNTSRSEGQIKIRFNTLVDQFENNSKYTPYKESQTIDENEDISYEISVHDKQYAAVFLPKTSGIVWFTIGKVGSKYVIDMFYENPKNEANGSDL
jgi:ATP-dependent protease HslVU (ClpYQ) ATPase subunit